MKTSTFITIQQDSVVIDRGWGEIDRLSEEDVTSGYRQILRCFADRNAMSEEDTADGVLIAGEVLSNAWRYGLGDSIQFVHKLKTNLQETWLELNFCYQTEEFCTCRAMPDLELLLDGEFSEFEALSTGTRGIPLILNLSDECNFDFETKPGSVAFSAKIVLGRMA